MTDTERTNLCNQVGTYLFENVWNAPHSEYRQNFIPKVISSIPKTGSIDLKACSVVLPTSASFYVYAISKCCLAGMIIGSPTWIKVSDYINTKPFDLRFHGTNGEYLWREGIYMIDHPFEDMCIIAVEKNMARRILGTGYNFKKIFFAPYYDSDRDQVMDSKYYRPTTNLMASDVYGATLTGDIVFVNGRESVVRSVSDIKIGDYVEVINDPDIVADFTIDLTDRDQNRIYRSEINSCFKYLIHIPKSSNPENYIITHNTCDFFVRPKNVAESHLKGLFVHRCYPVKEGITQVTHNDFSIPDTILTGYLNALDTTEVEIRCIARTHSKSRHMVDETNYINWLYKLDDKTILDMLEKPPVGLEFWSAAHLEQSLFIKMLFITPAFTDPLAMDEYIDALGYYNTISLLCERVQRYQVTSSMTRVFNVPIPISLRSSRVKANLIINGLKINDTLYSTSQNGEYLTYNIDPSVGFNVGDTLITEMFETPTLYCEKFTPSAVLTRQRVIGDFKLYRIRSTEIDSFTGDYFSNQETFNETYELIPNENWDEYGSVIVSGGLTYFEFVEDKYGFEYAFISKKYFSKVLDERFDIQDLDRETITRGPINVIGRKFTSSTTVSMITPEDASFICYLNGRELIPGVDFSIIRKKSTMQNLVYTWIHIQNVSYLKPTDNTIECYVTGDPIYGSAYEFMHDNKLLSFKPLIYWKSALAILTADGIAHKDLYLDNGYLSIEDNTARTGSISYVRAMCPITVKEFVDAFSPNQDIERITNILIYFRQFAAEIPPIEVLPYSHKVYSVLLNQVLHDALTGELDLTYDPDIPKMLLQIPNYLDIKDGDVVFQYTCECGQTVTLTPGTICNNCGGVVKSNLDLRYIDILPSYRLNESYNPDLYSAMLQLMRAILPIDSITDGDSVNV